MKLGLETGKVKNFVLNFLIPIVCTAVSIGLILLIIYPAYKDIPLLNGKLKDSIKLRDQLKDKQQKLSRFIDFKSILEEDSVLVNNVLPIEQNIPGLLDQISQIATESGFDLTKLSYSVSDTSGLPPDQAPTYNTVLVSLGADGTYNQMITFMKAIENAARLVNISNIRFGALESDNVNKLSFTFILSAPYMDVQSAATVDDPISLDVSSGDFVSFINKIKGMRYFERSGDLSKLGIVATEVKPEEVTESTQSSSTPRH